jgi:hypothetical protein
VPSGKSTSFNINGKTLLDQAHEREAAVRAANRQLLRENAQLTKRLGERREFFTQLVGSVVALEPYPQFTISPKAKTGSAVVPNLDLSDWHTGEVVQVNETEGFNRFNWAILQAGMFALVDDFLNWVEVQRQFYRIDDCAVTCKGDFVSGDIHSELLATNEFPLPVQTAKAGWLLGEVLHRLAGRFKTVTVWQNGGDNHGRLQKKPQAKQKAANNMNYLVYTIANQAVNRCSNLRIEQSDGIKQLAVIAGKRFLVEHGDTLKGWAGLPFYAFQREVGREAIRRMNTDRGFHYLSLAHFHTPYFLENRIIGNGSMSGTSEFDHACGRHSLPCQVAFLVHPKHGVFNFTPFVRRDVKGG